MVNEVEIIAKGEGFAVFLGVLRYHRYEQLVMPHLSGEEDRLSPRFRAFAVTLPVFADGECLPLPRSKGGAFPFLLTFGGYPTAPSNFARGQGVLRGLSTPRMTCYISLLITEGLHQLHVCGCKYG